MIEVNGVVYIRIPYNLNVNMTVEEFEKLTDNEQKALIKREFDKHTWDEEISDIEIDSIEE